MREKRLQGQRPLASHEKTEEKAAFLAQSDIFRHLNPGEISDLERLTTAITCSAGRILYRPSETGTALFLLKTGRVQLYHLSTDGRKLITAMLGTGACFGEMPLVGHGMHTSFAEAVEDSQIYAMNKHDVERLLMQKPEVALAFLQLMGQRFAALEAQLIDTTFKSTPARLATLLLHLACSQEHDGQALVVDGVSHEELAERLGVYRETVSTALRELKEVGAIEPGRKHITISNPTLLEDMASLGGKAGRTP